MNKKIKIIWILRIILLAILIIFYFVFNSTTKTNCEAGSFEIEGKEYSTEEFFDLYHSHCLVKRKYISDIDIISNLSG